MAVKRTHHTIYDTRYHIVFSPKYRKKILKGGLKKLIEKIFSKICYDNGWEILEMEIGGDHVHFFINFAPKYSISKVVGTLKSISASIIFKKMKWIKKHYWRGDFWEDGFFVRTIGDDVTSDVVKNYIKSHREGQPKKDDQLNFFDEQAAPKPRWFSSGEP